MCWDHPRSRGEHSRCGGGGEGSDGPSPLARGALQPVHEHRRGRRTIPARAGSTAARPSARTVPRDHPRSRGEHDVAPERLAARKGPSPLARGALRYVCSGRVQAGTIPARAGSTSSTPRWATGGRDHPRSRGEHASTPSIPGRCQGTIPARAGSTIQVPRTCIFRWDHPRSRGEHQRGGGVLDAGEGPSPLARGARPDTWRWRPPALDHPRSRGEHPTIRTSSVRCAGPSPLARGAPSPQRLR